MIIPMLGESSDMALKIQMSSGWSFKQQDWSEDEWLPVANVPSQVHMDLLANRK